MKTLLKSTVAIFMLAVLAFAFTACSGGKTQAVADIVTAVTKDYPMSEAMLEVKGADNITNKIGFEASQYTDVAAYVNNSGTEQDEIIIVKTTDADSKTKVKEILNKRLETKLNSTKNYLPEQYKIVNTCSVSENGDYVWLIISKDADAMNKIVEEQLK